MDKSSMCPYGHLFGEDFGKYKDCDACKIDDDCGYEYESINGFNSICNIGEDFDQLDICYNCDIYDECKKLFNEVNNEH